MRKLKLALCLCCLAGLALAANAAARLQGSPPAGGMHSSQAPVGLGTVAKATLTGTDARLKGTVTFTQVTGGVHVVAEVSGATPGKHGLQIRDKGACVAPFTSTGEVLNPYHMPHGCPPLMMRQLGDLGNIEVKADGTGRFDQVVDKISVVDPHHLVVGHAIVMLSGEDDCKTAPADKPIACGVIKKS
jgi:Cu-Zn family superoxide dismutase